MTSDVEKASIRALGGSPAEAPKNSMISRTLSLTPSGKKVSCLPVTPIAQSNPESAHGGNTAYPAASVVSTFVTFTICCIVITVFSYLI